MEFINDPTLEDFFIFGTLSYDRWLKVLVAVAERLQEVHEAGIVHNDFKLDNCLVSFNYGECNAHIIDFGLSGKIGQPSVMAGTRPCTFEKELKSKPWYAAETFTGGPLQPATDVVGFSFLIINLSQNFSEFSPELVALAKEGMSRDMSKRPTLN